MPNPRFQKLLSFIIKAFIFCFSFFLYGYLYDALFERIAIRNPFTLLGFDVVKDTIYFRSCVYFMPSHVDALALLPAAASLLTYRRSLPGLFVAQSKAFVLAACAFALALFPFMLRHLFYSDECSTATVVPELFLSNSLTCCLFLIACGSRQTLKRKLLSFAAAASALFGAAGILAYLGATDLTGLGASNQLYGLGKHFAIAGLPVLASCAFLTAGATRKSLLWFAVVLALGLMTRALFIFGFFFIELALLPWLLAPLGAKLGLPGSASQP